MTRQQIENELLRISARKLLLEEKQEQIDNELERLTALEYGLCNQLALISAAKVMVKEAHA